MTRSCCCCGGESCQERSGDEVLTFTGRDGDVVDETIVCCCCCCCCCGCRVTNVCGDCNVDETTFDGNNDGDDNADVIEGMTFDGAA